MSQSEASLVGPIRVPDITETDLVSFHEAHFGASVLSTFIHDFFNPDAAAHNATEEQTTWEEYEDDGLGYYPDGVKRTLTDEQIAIFRHSELQTLRREEERRQAQRKRSTSTPLARSLDDGELEEGEMPNDENTQLVAVVSNSKKRSKNKKKKKRGSGNSNKKQWEPDPERRKRTWDVVETGLDALAYDESEMTGAAAQHTSQRRRITYDEEG